MILLPRADACFATFAALMLFFLVPAPAAAQDNDRDEEMTTTTGTVSISTARTLVVRGENGRYQVFVYDRAANRPASISVGSGVRILSRPGAESGVRVASRVTVTSPPRAADAANPTDEVVPEAVRDVERAIRRQVRRYNVGVRTGLALDPELVLIGVQSQFATGFDRRLVFRPNVDFAWGELTTMIALNLEAIYRLAPQGRWRPYFGAGPGFNFINASLRREDRDVDFNDFDYDTCLNLLGGVENRNGMFLEMKASVYADPAPSLRIILGYNF